MDHTTDSKGIEQVLADWRGDAQRMRARRLLREADLIDQVLDDVSQATEDYRRFVSEEDAQRRTGKSKAWLRARFEEWMRLGHARLDERRRREYRLVVLPQRANASVAYEAGREAGRRTA